MHEAIIATLGIAAVTPLGIVAALWSIWFATNRMLWPFAVSAAIATTALSHVVMVGMGVL